MDEMQRREEMQCRKEICRSLKETGVREGGILLVHSSFKSLGHVPGGIETLIGGMLDALGDRGTLLMPALSYLYVNADPANPVFDALNTPSNVGAIPEYFRKRPGTLRSIHPTHSVCGAGPRAEELLSQHEKDNTPCGPNSPFRKLYENSGQILFLGCGMGPNTSMHAVEEVAGSPYLFGETWVYRIIHPDGKVSPMSCKRHNFVGNKLRQRYDRVAEVLGEGEMKSGSVLAAKVYLLEAKPLWEKTLEVMKRNPYYFVDKIDD